MDAWSTLARNLRSRHPDDWADRLQSYRDGSNPDLKCWRGIGGVSIEAAPPRTRKPYGPRCARAPDHALSTRNGRILSAAQTGTSIELIAERFELSIKRVRTILHGFGETAVR